jgi:hypothetical protein
MDESGIQENRKKGPADLLLDELGRNLKVCAHET